MVYAAHSTASATSHLPHAMGKHLLMHRYGGKMPQKGSFFPCLPELPMAWLEVEPTAVVSGAGGFRATLPDWLKSIIAGTFVHADGKWLIDHLKHQEP